MDPITAVGLVSSCLQLIAALKLVLDLGRDAVNAPKEQRALFREVQNLEPLLTDLQRRLQLPGSQSINGLQSLKDPLLDFKETMDRIAERLRSANESGSEISKAFIWTLWKKAEAEADLAKIERFKALLNTWLGLGIWDKLQRHHEEIEQMFTTIGNTQRLDHYKLFTEVRNVAQNQQDLQDSVERENIVKEREKIIDWLSPPNFFARHADIFGTRQKGTGLWFLDEVQFQDWLYSSGGTLWCYGIPGAGKTVLMSIVVDYLRNHFQGNNIGVAVAYLNHKESDAQSPSNILAGLWWQLVSERPISPVVQQLYEKHQNQRTKPSLDEVREIFCSTVAEFSKVFIVVDAFDEYPEAHRFILLDTLATMGGTVSLMLTSRPNIAPESFFPTASVLEIRAKEEDIRRYVAAQIQNSFRLSKHVKARPELREEIETKIAKNADGMFLLTKLHIDSLATKSTVKAVGDALQNLPEDLEHTYNEAMDRINAQNKDDREIARRTLIWVAYAKRPLTVFELQVALAIEPDSKVLDADGLLDIGIIISVCVGLVIVDASEWFGFIPGRRIVRLVHLTIQNYLDRIQPTRFPEAQTEITRQCLTYLSYNDVPKSNYQQDGLLSYASSYCLLHAAGEPELVLQDSIIKFLGDAHRWQALRAQRRNADGLLALHPGYDGPSQWRHEPWPPVPSKLWVAALFGLQEVARYLFESAEPIREEEKEGSLIVASHWNCLGVARLLIKHRTNVDANEGSALQAATKKEHVAVIQLLLEHGANVNLQGGHDITALQTASWLGNTVAVQLLLDYGANVAARGEHALQAASFRGHVAVVQLLLGHGADVNLQGEGDTTALLVASVVGSTEVVQLLLDHGADANKQGGHFGTALQAASEKGNLDVVQLLLDHDADVNLEGGYYRTALQAASMWGSNDIVQVLLENGADVNLQGGHYGTALQAASMWGSNDIVQALLEKDADMNLQGGYYGTALQAAARWGSDDIVQVLLENGAGVNLQGGYYGTALQAASRWGSNDIVQVLLENGADVNLQGGYYGTALQAAAWIGSTEVVQLLLENGADVNLQGGYYGNALQAASANGLGAMVQLLLERGADLNARGGEYGTAYHAAKSKGHTEVVELLVAHGADTSLDMDNADQTDGVSDADSSDEDGSETGSSQSGGESS
ncbi:ankyrin repeat-containing domain protein [Mycena rebaudengoi]|nr:ankyrin repeat-containing domain protein [Mycena rebaudengoi]